MSAIAQTCQACGGSGSERRIGVNRVWVCRECGMGKVIIRAAGLADPPIGAELQATALRPAAAEVAASVE